MHVSLSHTYKKLRKWAQKFLRNRLNWDAIISEIQSAQQLEWTKRPKHPRQTAMNRFMDIFNCNKFLANINSDYNGILTILSMTSLAVTNTFSASFLFVYHSENSMFMARPRCDNYEWKLQNMNDFFLAFRTFRWRNGLSKTFILCSTKRRSSSFWSTDLPLGGSGRVGRYHEERWRKSIIISRINQSRLCGSRANEIIHVTL